MGTPRYADYKEDASVHGLSFGQQHPVTGMYWSNDHWLTAAAIEHKRRVDLLKHAKHRAQQRDLAYDLTMPWLCGAWPLDGVCPVLGVELEWATKSQDASPSIDRIDPLQGYLKSNCRVISKRANTLKNNASLDELRLVLADAVSLRTK